MNDNTKQRLVRIALCIPFLLGLSWTLCHPILSIVTGELKCRGIFIDEHALDPQQYSTDPYSYPTSIDDLGNDLGLGSSLNQSLCQRLDPSLDHSNHSPSCLSTLDFDLVKILPFHSTPVTIPTEAIVLIIPSPSSFHRDIDSYHVLYFETLLGQLIARLQNSPWLAKTVLIVVPTNHNSVNLDKTVYTFLQAYHGGLDETHYTLPPSFNMFMIRQLLVMDLYSHKNQDQHSFMTASSAQQIQVLPQGPRGLLPNLDLVFVTIQILGRFLPSHYKVAVHPWDMTWCEHFLSQKVQSLNLGPGWYPWSIELANLGAFATTMIRGPHGPHSPALERGIDSITIRFQSNNELNLSSSTFKSRRNTLTKVEIEQHFITQSQLFQSTEHIVRALSNLHERLHHSVNLYLLPSPTKFVSHGEYIYPCILILLPFVIRAMSLLFIHIDYFQYHAVMLSIFIITLHSFLVYFAAPYMNRALLAMVYVSLVLSWHRFVGSHVLGSAQKDLRQSLQFTACLFVLYSHAPLVLCHVSLVYPSAILWAILLGFPRYSFSSRVKEFVKGIPSACLVFLTWPPTLIVPYAFQDYTVYICLVYIPLHFVFTLLVYQGFIGKKMKEQ